MRKMHVQLGLQDHLVSLDKMEILAYLQHREPLVCLETILQYMLTFPKQNAECAHQDHLASLVSNLGSQKIIKFNFKAQSDLLESMVHLDHLVNRDILE